MRRLDVLSGLAWLADQGNHVNAPALWALAIGAVITAGLIGGVWLTGWRPTARPRRRRPSVEKLADPTYDPDLDDPRRTR